MGSAVEFFVDCVPPTTTSQMKRLNRTTGAFFKSHAQEAAETTFYAVLLPHRVPKPVPGPVALSVTLVWPWRKSEPKNRRALGIVPHTVKPDGDNAAKQLIDILANLRFIENDATISDLRVSKRWGDRPGIGVRIETVEAEGTK